MLREFSLAFDVDQYVHKKSINKLLAKLHKFLLRVDNQKTMLLSYKLFKTYLRINSTFEESLEKE